MCLFAINSNNSNIISFASNIQDNIHNNYSLVVLKNKYENLTELEGKNIGYLNSTIDLNINYNSIRYYEIDDLFDNLDSEILDAIIILDNQPLDSNKYQKLMFNEEQIPVFKRIDNTSLIYVTSDNINIILGINHKSKQIIIISIPENYYIPFKGENDTISNINKYGTIESIKAIENLIENKINYYIKLDSNSLENLINEIGNIEVYSNYNFVSLGFEYKEGLNILNGKQAITFSNYNSLLLGGSRVQSENQLKVLEAIIKKLLDNNEFLNHLEELKEVIKTNIPSVEIMKIIKEQILYQYDWNIINYGLDGDDTYQYTYSSKCCKLSVIKPDIKTVNNAITTIEYLKTDSVFN